MLFPSYSGFPVLNVLSLHSFLSFCRILAVFHCFFRLGDFSFPSLFCCFIFTILTSSASLRSFSFPSHPRALFLRFLGLCFLLILVLLFLCLVLIAFSYHNRHIRFVFWFASFALILLYLYWNSIRVIHIHMYIFLHHCAFLIDILDVFL